MRGNPLLDVGQEQGKLAGAVTLTAIVISFGLLTFLWAEVSSVPSQTWTGIAVVFMLASAILTKAHLSDDRRLSMLLGLYLLLYAAGTTIGYFFVTEFHSDRTDLLLQNYVALALCFVYYAFGAVSQDKRYWPGFAAALVIIAIYTLQSKSDFSAEELARRYQFDAVIVGYQQLGDSLVMATLVLIAMFRKRAVVYALSAGVVILLFIIPSRSALVFGTLALLSACLLISTPKARVALITFALIAAVTMRVWVLSNLSESLDGSRHEGLLTQKEDESNLLRAEQLSVGADAIMSNPIFGQFGFELDMFRQRGFYMHNIFDCWVQAGLLPFLALLTLFVLVGRQWFLQWKFDRARAYQTLPFLLFAGLSYVFARNPTYVNLYFCIGYFSATLMQRSAPAPALGR